MLTATLMLCWLAADPVYGEVDSNGVYHEGPWEAEWNYAQARRAGDALYLSGHVASGADMAEQMQNVYAKLRRTLGKYGLGPEHVVRENLYTVDIEATRKANAPRAEFYGGHAPAATWVQIERLFSADALVEVELQARFPEREKD